MRSAAKVPDLSPLSLFRSYNAYFISVGQFNPEESTPDGTLSINVLSANTLTVSAMTEPRHQRPELPKPWLPLAPLVSSVDSVTAPVSTGVGTNCAILSPERIS
jgi:hypothetical protein